MKPPYRADQVGSLLRPPALVAARERFRRGEIDASGLREIEDREIAAVVAKQEAIGLRAVTDGEFRRDWWHLDFLAQFEGVTLRENPGPKFGTKGEQPPIATVTGRVRCERPVMADHFAYLRSVAQATPKFAIPSPSMLHLRGGRAAISREAYPDLGAFWGDVALAYQQAIRQLADAGCSYLQLDDVSFAYLCDPKVRDACRANGDAPETLAATYAATIRRVLEDRPAGMTIAMHTCRGNFRSAWVAEGGYEPVAEGMFASGVDAFFLEFDSTRAGGFEPLRYLPRGKKAVLGLVTTKTGMLEDKDALCRRIDEAARYVPLEDLCLSPQCGFSSTHHGNALTEDAQWRKLACVVEVARDVWG